MGFNIGQYAYTNTPYQSEPMHLREMDQQDYPFLVDLSIWDSRKVAINATSASFDEQGPGWYTRLPSSRP